MDSIDQYIEKPEGESDLGPNADGMGVISSVPFAEEAFVRKVGKRDRKKPAIFDGAGGDGGTAGDFRVLLAAPLEKGFSGRLCEWVLGHDGWRAALQLAHDPDPRVAFRASAALEYAYFANPDGLRPYQEQFLANFLTAASTSAQRHYAKVLENLIRSGRITLSSAQMQQVAEAAFDRMIDPRARPAVKVWSMEILFLLAPALPWVDEQAPRPSTHTVPAFAGRSANGGDGEISRRAPLHHCVRFCFFVHAFSREGRPPTTVVNNG